MNTFSVVSNNNTSSVAPESNTSSVVQHVAVPETEIIDLTDDRDELVPAPEPQPAPTLTFIEYADFNRVLHNNPDPLIGNRNINHKRKLSDVYCSETCFVADHMGNDQVRYTDDDAFDDGIDEDELYSYVVKDPFPGDEMNPLAGFHITHRVFTHVLEKDRHSGLLRWAIIDSHLFENINDPSLRSASSAPWEPAMAYQHVNAKISLCVELAYATGMLPWPKYFDIGLVQEHLVRLLRVPKFLHYRTFMLPICAEKAPDKITEFCLLVKVEREIGVTWHRDCVTVNWCLRHYRHFASDGTYKPFDFSSARDLVLNYEPFCLKVLSIGLGCSVSVPVFQVPAALSFMLKNVKHLDRVTNRLIST